MKRSLFTAAWFVGGLLAGSLGPLFLYTKCGFTVLGPLLDFYWGMADTWHQSFRAQIEAKHIQGFAPGYELAWCLVMACWFIFPGLLLGFLLLWLARKGRLPGTGSTPESNPSLQPTATRAYDTTGQLTVTFGKQLLCTK